jgi:large repetitive protein
MRRGVLLCTTILIALAVAPAAGHAGVPQPGCGDTITVDTKLTRNLVNCPNNGVIIGADNITLDLNGHVIDGDDAEFTDCPPDQACDIGVVDFDHRGATIEGGTVREFTFGVLVVGGSDSRFARLDLSHHFFSGLLLAETSDSVVDGITASDNGLTTDQAGVDIFDSDHLALTRNTVFGNGDIGFFVSGLDDGRFEENSLAGNLEGETGILLDHGNRNVPATTASRETRTASSYPGTGTPSPATGFPALSTARRSVASASASRVGPETSSRATSCLASIRPASR